MLFTTSLMAADCALLSVIDPYEEAVPRVGSKAK